MFNFLRRWLKKPSDSAVVEFCSSCWRRFEDSNPWIETWKRLKICRDCLMALNKQLHLPMAELREPTRLVNLNYSENPYQPPQIVNNDDPCLLCGLVFKGKAAVLFNKQHVCERCISVSLQLLAESDGRERVRL